MCTEHEFQNSVGEELKKSYEPGKYHLYSGLPNSSPENSYYFLTFKNIDSIDRYQSCSFLKSTGF